MAKRFLVSFTLYNSYTCWMKIVVGNFKENKNKNIKAKIVASW